MRSSAKLQIVDITGKPKYEKYLYKCLAPMPYRKYRSRREYLEKALPKGFHKKLLIVNNEVIGQIEYAPAEVSGYPITGDNVVVMNCIWVLRKVRGHHFGLLLVRNIVKSERSAFGFATIGLEGEPSPWFKKWQMEKLGFAAIDSIVVRSMRKPNQNTFTAYLMWMPKAKKAKPPTWNRLKLLNGETFCSAHPLYHPQTWQGRILEAQETF